MRLRDPIANRKWSDQRFRLPGKTSRLSFGKDLVGQSLRVCQAEEVVLERPRLILTPTVGIEKALLLASFVRIFLPCRPISRREPG
jgi:hypothetical protein